ncbi:GntR family transcriptional regulator [Burkholderia ubonensis]|uniref:aminotransferase-like domain-containing protein n=1 Tax=Burkholderia ubonensis TaxID=101571 RepID=UPI00075B2C9C|nr:PLP-dependent aminotransferase family protein [Burkholderia ubonensis]KWB76681.1 GntR family transcriptional regulator [Burkholderia ubonensis]
MRTETGRPLTDGTSHVIQFARGVPPIDAIPVAELVEVASDVLRDESDTVFQYAPLGGYRGDPRLRERLGALYRVDPEQVFVGNGSLQVLDLLAGHLLDGKDATVYTEAPTYDRVIQIFERHGARVIGIPVEADGVDVAQLEARLRAERAALFYTIPDFQNPTGATLDESKRRAVVELASQYGCTIVEDVPYRELRYHGAAPSTLTNIANGATHVVTIGSLTKLLSPGLRIGYAICDAQTAVALALRAEGTYLSPAPLCQAIAARALERGLVGANVERVCALLRPRHDAAVSAIRRHLGNVLLAVPNGGYYAGVSVRTNADEAAFLSRARAAGVVLTIGTHFYPRANCPAAGLQFLRLPFHALDEADFEDGVQRLASILADGTTGDR